MARAQQLRSLALLSVLVMAASPRAFGQTTFATITGMVTDPNGSVVPGASITAIHVASNYRYAAKSNELGYYTVAQLREGVYTLSAKAPGFKEYVATGISLVARDVRRFDVKLELGTLTTKVEVTAGAALIESETARISDTKPFSALVSLPINANSNSQRFGLTPGVLLTADGNFNLKFNGGGSNQYDMSIDGVSNMNGADGGTIGPLMPPNEAIEEYRVDTSGNSAEFGGVGQITFISKSGTNQVHGSAYDYYSTPMFRARNPFASSRGTGISHVPGFSVGGPILLPKIYNGRNKTFFFFALETGRGSDVQQLLNPTVPLAPWRTGDFSGLLPGTVIKDPLAGGGPFPGNRIPASRLNTVALKIQDRFYPLPNYGDTSVLASQNYRELAVRPFDPTTYLFGRIDHRFTDKLTFFVRYTWYRQHDTSFQGNLPTIGRQWNDRNDRALASSFTFTLRPNLINEFRVGYDFNNNPKTGPVMGKPLVESLGLVGLVDNLPDYPGIFKVSFSGLGLTGISQPDMAKPGFRNLPILFQDHVSWFRGRHNLKMGGQIEYVNAQNMGVNGSLYGNATFSNRFTGFPYADFLLGIPTTVSRGPAPILENRTSMYYDLFATDDIKVLPSLTVNLGVRYELHLPWQNSPNYMAVFDPNLGKIVVPDGALKLVSPLLPSSYISVVEAGQTGGVWDKSTLLHADTNNVAPRIGIAYRPWGPNTVIRSGFGVYYDVVPPKVQVANIPFIISEPSYTNPADAPTVILPRVFPAASIIPTTINIPPGMSPHPHQPYSLQYNFTIERQQWGNGFRISYIGNGTRQGFYSANLNQPVANGQLYINKPRPFPNYPNINYVRNGAGHQYHSFNLEAQRRFRGGFTYQAAWVWSRDISYGTPEDAYNEVRERGVTVDNPTHRLTGNFIYELPFGKGKRFLSGRGRLFDLMAGGWQISSIFESFSGQFLTPLWSGPDPTGTAFTSSSTPAVVTIRPDQLRSPNLPPGQRSVTHWFDAGAFAAPEPGSFGTSAPGVIKGPGSWILNSGLYKSFTVWERVRFRWEFTATNVLNHPNWANPGTNITSLAQVGVISGVGTNNTNYIDAIGPRSMRMGFRVTW